jgi:hypothetical protein
MVQCGALRLRVNCTVLIISFVLSYFQYLSMKISNYKKRISYLILDSEKKFFILGLGRFLDLTFYWMHNYLLMKDEKEKFKTRNFCTAKLSLDIGYQ